MNTAGHIKLGRRSLVAALLAGRAAAAVPGFTFATPAGFVSLKDDRVVLELGDREAKFRSEASTADAYAVKLKDGVAVASFVAKVYSGGAPLKTWTQYLERSLEKTPFAKETAIAPAHPLWVGGVECAFADVECVTDGVALRERYYVLPGGDHWAFIKLIARAEAFAGALPLAEDAVATTRGVRPSALEEPSSGESQGATLFVIGAATMAAALLVSWFRNRAAFRRGSS